MPILSNTHQQTKIIDVIHDPRLSLQSKGLWIYLYYKPDDWKFEREDILKHCSNGSTSLKSCLNELKDFGFLTITRTREGNAYSGSVWTLLQGDPA